MSNSTMEIRKAAISDASKIGSCHYHCWQETYRGLIADSYLDSMDESKNMERFEKMYPIVGQYQYVVESENQIIGFFDITKARENYAPFEVQGLYVRKVYHGQGYGRKIIEYIKEKCKGEHFYLWCLKSNPTCGFYEHMGGQVITQKKVSVGGREEGELCYLFNSVRNDV